MSNLKLTIDLLPKGAWGNNLSRRLPKKDWDTLRNIAYEKAGHKCVICGYKTDDLEAHEVWTFDISSKTQTLKDIVALCPACHGVKHFRNSTRIGYGEHAKAHFLKINDCTPLVLARHVTEEELLFEERNTVLRWKLKANLYRFGGNGLEIKERFIPLIINPYEGIDFETVKHTISGSADMGAAESGFYTDIIVLQALTNASDSALSDKQKGAGYFTAHKQNALPPQIRSISVDNYVGTITVDSDRINKIQWMSGDKVFKTKYNFGGKFITEFSVEDLEEPGIRFVLFGAGGATCSQTFGLREA